MDAVGIGATSRSGRIGCNAPCAKVSGGVSGPMLTGHSGSASGAPASTGITSAGSEAVLKARGELMTW